MKGTYLFFISVFLFSQTPGQLPTDNALKDPLDSAVQSAVNGFFVDSCHVGLSLAVFHKGKISFYNYGSVSKEKRQLPTMHSLYEIGSVTKTFTGTLLAQAVLENKVKLDVDVRQYLQEPYPNLEYQGVPITLRQLSTHQSSLPNNLPDNSDLFKHPDFDKLPFQLIAMEKNYDNKRYRAELHQLKPDTIPGSVYFKYSNIGVKLLAFILEDVYGKPYEHLLAKKILSPLKMTKTVLTIKDSTLLVKGYSPTGKPMPFALDNAGAAGGIRSCTADLARYLTWQMDERHATVKESHSLLHGDLFYYARGYNWNVEKKGARKKIWQSGGTFGMSAAIILFPEEETGFVFLANDACMDTQGKMTVIAETVLNAIR